MDICGSKGGLVGATDIPLSYRTGIPSTIQMGDSNPEIRLKYQSIKVSVRQRYRR